MNIIKRKVEEWRLGPVAYAIKYGKGKAGIDLKGKEVEYFYPKGICPKDYGNHIKGDVCCLFGYRVNVLNGSIEALYHCKICQEVLHFPLDKNPKEMELYNERKKETNNFKKGIKIK